MPEEASEIIVEPEPSQDWHELLHILLMGESGGGKSSLCATFEKPMLVFLFDPPGQERAYLKRGKPSAILKSDHCYYRDVISATTGKLIIRIEYWGEPNPLKPTAYPRFVTRTTQLEAEIEKLGWKTVVADTATYFELSARYYSENSINSNNKRGEAHYGFSAHACEQHLMTRWPNLLMANSIVCCHIDDQKVDAPDGSGTKIVKLPAFPGKLPKRMPAGFGECWRVYYAGQKAGKAVHLLQTHRREENAFECKTAVGVMDGCVPHYDAIWKSIEKQEVV